MVFFVLFVGFLARYAEDVEATDSLTEQRLMRASAEEERDVQFIGRLNLSSALSSLGSVSVDGGLRKYSFRHPQINTTEWRKHKTSTLPPPEGAYFRRINRHRPS